MTRREFAAALAVAPVITGAPAESHSISLVTPGTPGQPMIVTGTLVGADGKTPLSNWQMFLYHTDAEGYYNKGDDDARKARIRGWLRTDTAGRYEIRSIKPAPYANGGAPAHIHVHLKSDTVAEHWIDLFLFAGDPHLDRRDLERSESLGRFAYVMKERRAGKTLEYSRDIRFDPAMVARRPLG